MKNPKGTSPFPPMTPAEIERAIASMLLFGIPHLDGKQQVFPSRTTSPTEKEARQALAKILRSGDVPITLLRALADQIEPDGKHPLRLRRIEFKNLSQGHPKDFEHFVIARRVYSLRKKNEKNAIPKVAREVGLDPRHVARIWSENRERCEEAERLRERLKQDDASS